ncbi:hypothetical protein JCM11641_004181 [Rhodosporidiobolus odoratus]
MSKSNVTKIAQALQQVCAALEISDPFQVGWGMHMEWREREVQALAKHLRELRGQLSSLLEHMNRPTDPASLAHILRQLFARAVAHADSTINLPISPIPPPAERNRWPLLTLEAKLTNAMDELGLRLAMCQGMQAYLPRQLPIPSSSRASLTGKVLTSRVLPPSVQRSAAGDKGKGRQSAPSNSEEESDESLSKDGSGEESSGVDPKAGVGAIKNSKFPPSRRQATARSSKFDKKPTEPPESPQPNAAGKAPTRAELAQEVEGLEKKNCDLELLVRLLIEGESDEARIQRTTSLFRSFFQSPGTPAVEAPSHSRNTRSRRARSESAAEDLLSVLDAVQSDKLGARRPRLANLTPIEVIDLTRASGSAELSMSPPPATATRPKRIRREYTSSPERA